MPAAPQMSGKYLLIIMGGAIGFWSENFKYFHSNHLLVIGVIYLNICSTDITESPCAQCRNAWSLPHEAYGLDGEANTNHR